MRRICSLAIPAAGLFNLGVLNQQTLNRTASFSGIGLHSGNRVNMKFLPAPPNSGIRFRRVDLDGKPEIEAYGIAAFNARCRESVLGYLDEWARLTERIGFWVDTKDAYVTYHRSYVESVWWALSELFRKGLLYQDYKVVWWWAQGGTALSSGEVGQGYKEVADPSVYVAFPLVEDPSIALVASPAGPGRGCRPSRPTLRPQSPGGLFRAG